MASVFTQVFYKLAGKTIPGLDEDGTTQLSTTGSDDLIIVQSVKDLGKDAIDGGTSDATSLDYDELRISSEKAESYVLDDGIIGIEQVAINEDLCDETDTGNGGYGDAAINVDASAVTNALTIIGNQGNNALIGTILADTIYGSLGNDILTGGAGDDDLQGGNDNDTITGGTGADNLQGGSGDDLFIINAITENASGEVINGTNGTNDVVAVNDISPGTLTIQGSSGFRNIDSIVIGTVDKSGKISSTGTLAISIDATLAGSTNTNPGTSTISLTGNAGNNSLTGNNGSNTIDGGKGDDILVGGGSTDTYIGGEGKDTMTGGSGKDAFKYLKTSELVDGETIDGSTGNSDTLSLDGAGTYTFKVDADLANVELVTMATTGKSDTAAIGVDLSAQTTETDFKVTGNSGVNKIVTSISTYADITGGAGNDTITTGNKNDVIDGGAGNDVIFSGDGIVGDATSGMDGDDITGGLGDDKITSGTGNDLIDAGLGKDTVNSGAGDDTIDTGTGNDTVLAGAGADEIYGAKGDDTIDGGEGNDIIFGDEGSNPGLSGNGADKLSGGLGSDTFVVEHVIWAKKDTIDGEGKSVAAGTDTTADTDTLVFAECQTQASTATGIFKIDAKLVKGIEAFVIDDDPFTSGENGTMPLGLDVSTYASAITLKGNAGDNVLKAGTKDDIITGNAGDDTITGGLGNDKFVLNDTTSVDTITDFLAGSDKLVFSDATFNLGANDTDGTSGTYTAFTAGILESTGTTFTSANARFGFDTSTGKLYYDADGSALVSTAVQIATLTGITTLAETDLLFTA